MDGQANKYRSADGNQITEMEDGAVIYSPDGEKVHYLNLAAAVIYQLCAEGCSTVEMAQMMQSAFALDDHPQDAVEQCLASLLAENLIIPC